jgi:hypothetical protein
VWIRRLLSLPEPISQGSLVCMSTVVEIESAIQRLTPSEVAELAGWLSEYQQMTQASAEVYAMYDREEESCNKLGREPSPTLQ